MATKTEKPNPIYKEQLAGLCKRENQMINSDTIRAEDYLIIADEKLRLLSLCYPAEFGANKPEQTALPLGKVEDPDKALDGAMANL